LKISEVVSELEHIKSNHGDVECLTMDDGEAHQVIYVKFEENACYFDIKSRKHRAAPAVFL